MYTGNAGTSKIAENLNEDILNFDRIYKIIKTKKIKLVIIGPEEPLVKGLANFLSKRKIKVFGPNKFAAKLEGSKAFMKNFVKQIKYQQQNLKYAVKNSSIRIFIDQ